MQKRIKIFVKSLSSKKVVLHWLSVHKTLWAQVDTKRFFIWKYTNPANIFFILSSHTLMFHQEFPLLEKPVMNHTAWISWFINLHSTQLTLANGYIHISWVYCEVNDVVCCYFVYLIVLFRLQTYWLIRHWLVLVQICICCHTYDMLCQHRWDCYHAILVMHLMNIIFVSQKLLIVWFVLHLLLLTTLIILFLAFNCFIVSDNVPPSCKS